MVSSTNVRKGMVILFNNEPALVLSHDIAKYGRAGSHNRCKIKGLKSGKIFNYDFYGNDKAEEVEVSSRNLQYLYHDEHKVYLMDQSSFEQAEVDLENIPGEATYLKEGVNYIGMFYEGEVISLQLPKKIAFEVIEAPEAVRGDTSGNALKEVKLENGVTFKAPLFIKKGDVILINTDTEEYAGKE